MTHRHITYSHPKVRITFWSVCLSGRLIRVCLWLWFGRVAWCRPMVMFWFWQHWVLKRLWLTRFCGIVTCWSPACLLSWMDQNITAPPLMQVEIHVYVCVCLCVYVFSAVTARHASWFEVAFLMLHCVCALPPKERRSNQAKKQLTKKFEQDILVEKA